MHTHNPCQTYHGVRNGLSSPPSSVEGVIAAISLPPSGGNNDAAATLMGAAAAVSGHRRLVSLDDINVNGLVAPPAPLPAPPLSPVKVPTIPDDYNLTATDENRLALCMVKLASRNEQVKYPPIKPRNKTQALVCPPHFYAWGTNWPDALKSLYYWHHGLTKEQQKREKQKWSNLPQGEKRSYNKNIKALEDNRPAPLSAESAQPESAQTEDTPPPQQATAPSRSSSRVVEQRAINLSIQSARQNGPSETARAAAGYVPPSDAAASAETNNTSSSAPSGRRDRQRTAASTTTVVQPTGLTSSNEEREELVRGREQSRKAPPKRRLGQHAHHVGAQADSQAAKSVKKAHIAGAVAMDTCHFPGLSEDQDNDLPRQVTVVCTLNMFPAYNPGGGRQRSDRAPRPTLTITADNRTDVALVNQHVEHYVNAVDNPADPRYANPPIVQLLTREQGEGGRSMEQTVRAHFDGVTAGRSRPQRRSPSSDVVLEGIEEERVDEIID